MTAVPHRFALGDHVLGPIGAYGRVVKIEPGVQMTVDYRVAGGSYTCFYTPEWFKEYGYLDMLRRVPPPQQK